MSALYIIAQPTEKDQDGGLLVSPLCCSGNPTATARSVNIIVPPPTEETTSLYSVPIINSNSSNRDPAFYDMQVALGQRLQPRNDVQRHTILLRVI